MNRAPYRPLASALLLLAAASQSVSAGDFEETTIHGILFIQIPAGTFTMGTTDEVKTELVAAKTWTRFEKFEQPAHQVTLSQPFLIGKTEITQKQWVDLLGKKSPAIFKGDELPVESVSFDDAQTLLATLNKAEPNRHFRLPTEAQWEYCARAGSNGPYGMATDGPSLTAETLTDHYGTKYAALITAENLGEYAWFAANSAGKTHPVGTRKPNAWGLCDLQGNVWEWCQDWYDRAAYTVAAVKDPLNTDAKNSTERVIRGGSWFLAASSQRAAYRGAALPDQKSGYIGFRVVCDP